MFTPIKESLNPFLFLVGCPRSGTTLLTRIIDAHQDIAMMHAEQHWIPRFFLKQIGVTAEGTATPALITELFKDPKFSKMDFELSQLETLINGNTSYSDFVRGIFDLYGKAQDKSRVGEKTPGNDLHIPVLHGLWPNTKIIHLIRDGRDVCLSAIHWKKSEKLKQRFRVWRENPVIGAAYWWRWHVQSGRRAGAVLGTDLYYEIRYEDLVHKPEEECRKLCSFLEVEYSPRMPLFHEGKTKLREGRDAKHAWIGITPGLRDWRRDMASDDVGLFEAAAGDTLLRFGYELGSSNRRTDIADRIQTLKEIFAEDAQSKIRFLPDDW